MKKGPPGSGYSSFELIDPSRVFAELRLRKGNILFDMGCGRGQYAIAAADFVGDKGTILATDLWKEGIVSLQGEAKVRGLENIKAWVGDISKRSSLATKSIDVCFMAAVLHDLVLVKKAEGAIEEAARVIKPKGLLAILEFRKVEGPPGPPLASRLSPPDVEQIAHLCGFVKKKLVEIGPYNYLMLFSLGG